MRAATSLVLAFGIASACDATGGQRAVSDSVVGTMDTGTTDGDVGPGKTDEPATTDANDASEAEVSTPVRCAAFAPSGTLTAYDTAGVFVLGGAVDLGLGGPLPDALVFEFTQNETGTFALGAGANGDYGTCHQCVRVVQDIDASGATHAKQFFASEGKLIVSPATPPYGPVVDLELVDVGLVEVGIRAIDYHSTPVEGGACLSQAGPVHLASGACVPDCGDHVCGDDGCGGSCGDCASGACALTGTACEAVQTCVDLPLYGDFTNPAAGTYKLGVADGGGAHLGAFGQKDFIQVEFYADGTGRFDLGAAPDDNYATCDRCVRMVVDGDRDFFQASGTMFVQSGSDPMGDPDNGGGDVSVVLDGIQLVEVSVDKDTFATTPVPGGACAILRAPKPITRAP